MPELAEIADELARATREREAITRFTAARPELSVEDAYAIQWHGIVRRQEGGERVVGAKLGLTSRAKQRAMSVDEPLYGWLTDGMIATSGQPLDLERFIHPRVEPEIGFLLGKHLRGPLTVADVLAGTESVFGALEVIDSRYANFDFRLPDVIADNASASAASLVTGSVTVSPRRAGDLRLVGCVLRRNGEIVDTAAGAAALEHPAAAVVWLLNRLAERGQSLPAGSIVLSGALTDAVPIGPGVTISAEFDGLGSVVVRA